MAVKAIEWRRITLSLYNGFIVNASSRLSITHKAMPRADTTLSQLARLPTVCRQRTLELLFPPACTGCRNPLAEGGPVAFCEVCLEQFAEFQPPYCFGCGASVPIQLQAGRTCGHCGGARPRFDRALALGPYDGLLREMLLRAKKPTGELAAVALAHRALAVHGAKLQELAPDVVCPVPSHWRRRMWRLASSPATMADVVARRLDLPLAGNLLCRRRHTAMQHTLPPTGRRENLRAAFKLGTGYKLQSAHVLLVDDILTTGATCNEAARTLRKAGAAQVSVLVIARSYSGR